MRRLVLAGLLSIIAVTATVLACLPASYLAPALERATAGMITLGDAQGTVWQGSAFLAGAPGRDAAIAPLLPGRFAWHISPAILLGRCEATLSNPEALSGTVRIFGNWRELDVSPAALTLPAERLASLGAPLNTIQPYGRVHLAWQALHLAWREGRPLLAGNMDLRLDDMATRLSPVKPLGAYNLAFAWHGAGADVALTSRTGPLLLNGTGKFENGRLHFDGTADAATGHEQQLANLLNLLGQRRTINGKDVIALSL